MKRHTQRWEEVETDNPIALLTRSRVFGERMLAAQVHLAKGCEVPVHCHESEQIAVLVSGKVRWIFGESGEEEVAEGGSVVVLPGGFLHGLVALEDSVVIDILSPPGPMGVDSK